MALRQKTVIAFVVLNVLALAGTPTPAWAASITLNWTAPGDDGSVGTATQYDIRYSTSTITDANWASATQATGEPAPKAAGAAETFAVTGLAASTKYYFVIKTADEASNWSALSNISSATTSDTVPPAAIANLSAAP
jgi:chitodextrinase